MHIRYMRDWFFIFVLFETNTVCGPSNNIIPKFLGDESDIFKIIYTYIR